MTEDPRRLLVATTIAQTAQTIMRGQLEFLQAHGFDVVLVSSPGPELDETSRREGVAVRPVRLDRALSPWADLVAAWRVLNVIRANRIEVSYVGTPKAGLVAGIAAMLARTPHRVYLLRGLRMETERGWRKAILWCAEWVALHTAHQVIVVSPSLLTRARELRLLGKDQGVVLGRGASNGVDAAAFEASPANVARGALIREALGIPESAFVFGFVGRLTVDKGLDELAQALEQVQARRPDVWLLAVGMEELSGLPERIRDRLQSLSNVRFTGWLDDTVPAYHAMDCLVLPTYREGFPNVSLEAGAAGKPVITTCATGAVDSVVNGRTGLLVRPRHSGELAAAMSRVVDDPDAAKAMGAAGRRFVTENFANAVVWERLADFLRTGIAMEDKSQWPLVPRQRTGPRLTKRTRRVRIPY